MWDKTHPMYQGALQALFEVSNEDDLATERLERAFGIAVGVATMLLPGVIDGEPPEPDAADKVAAEVMADLEDCFKLLPKASS